jgi:hypothetical protein
MDFVTLPSPSHIMDLVKPEKQTEMAPKFATGLAKN